MEGRRLVQIVFEGLEPPRPPLHIESDDKEFEAALSDALGAGVRVADWREFYERGAPFHRREGEGLGEWLDRVSASSYEWPNSHEAATAAVEGFLKRVRGIAGGKFLILKVLGPTETAEGFFTPPRNARGERLGQVAHRFGFGSLYVLKKGVAAEIYERIAQVVLEVVKAGLELESVDAIRVADDAATYAGPAYSQSFYEELYLPWHEKFAQAAKSRGKFALLHCDGDLRRGNLFERLATIYDGLHPLDISPKAMVPEALQWAREVAALRGRAGSAVFFTGAPVELIFNEAVSVGEFLAVPTELLRLHGPRRLVVATTHSEYPGRSYAEGLPRQKALALRELLRQRVSRGANQASRVEGSRYH